MRIFRMNRNNTNNASSAYQLEENERPVIDFRKDFEMMNLLISEYTMDDNGSMDNIFGRLLPFENEYIAKGWETLDEHQKDKNHAACSVKNHGAHLLLLLSYIMLSTVLDDKSNDIQM